MNLERMAAALMATGRHTPAEVVDLVLQFERTWDKVHNSINIDRAKAFCLDDPPPDPARDIDVYVAWSGRFLRYIYAKDAKP